MPRPITSIATPVAHLVGPGKIKIINGRLAFSTGKGTPTRLDPDALRSVFCYGGVGVTDDAMSVLLRHGVEVAWLSGGGHRCHGRLVGFRADKTGLRILQHQVLANPAGKLELAKAIVADKIAAQVIAARHAQRHGVSAAATTLARLDSALDNCRAARDVDVLRGIEGGASAAWYSLFGNLLREPWKFTQRVRRPPTDPVNALLSLAYTWLTSRTSTRCDALGLEVGLGALHEFRPGRPALACDLVEPLRVPAVDRWVIALCNEGRIAPADFVSTEELGVRLAHAVFARVLADFETHWMNAGIERLLSSTTERFVARIRLHANHLPTPAGMLSEGEGLGNGATGDSSKS